MLNKLPQSIRIVEVGPRDGLQNEPTPLSTEDKLSFINQLIDAGLNTIEITSFVRADKIPQMGDAKEILKGMKDSLQKGSFPCLVPNEKGMELAIEAGVKEIAVFTSTSETFNKKNINQSIAESLANIENITKIASKNNIKIRGYISTAFGCPYEGLPKNFDLLLDMTKKLQTMGAYDISIGDTIGIASPNQVVEYLSRAKKEIDIKTLSMHFHDTRGRALANLVTALEMGITSFDSSAGGLGGCPFAKGATGNLATEDLVGLCQSMGIETGVDMDKLSQASQFILGKIKKDTTSKFLQSYLSQ